MHQKETENIIAKLNNLYISTRKKYIIQNVSGYVTLDSFKNPTIWPLNDGLLQSHLDGKRTYGIFNGNTVNKFITFDVDYADEDDMARWATLNIIQTLESEFNIPSNDIHVSLSGSKGYHIDLYFDVPIEVDDAKAFYERVIDAAGLPSEKVEFRPTYTQAVKLPLGIHKKTGNRCWFVDRGTLEPIKSLDYLENVEPMDHSLILDALIDLTPEQEAEFEEIVERTDTSVTVVSESNSFDKAIAILDAGRLLQSNTRHETTLLLATFGNTQAWEREETVEMIMDILENTPTDYFSKDSKPEFWRKEAVRLVDLAFDMDYKLGNEDRPITIYRSEILAVLGVGTFRQKQLAYAMLVTSKRYGNTFYLTMNTAMKMMGIKTKQTVSNGITQLAEIGFIEYVRKGEVDKARSREAGHPIYKPNRYRILVDKPHTDELSVEVMPEESLVDVCYQLMDVSELKRIIKRTEFRNRWAA